MHGLNEPYIGLWDNEQTFGHTTDAGQYIAGFYGFSAEVNTSTETKTFNSLSKCLRRAIT